MAILLAKEIEKQIKNGNIIIEPFDPKQINPNSYDVRLGRKMLVLAPDVMVLDPKRDISEHYREIQPEIDADGQEYYVLHPGQLYLGVTEEYTETRGLVPIFEGKSKIARTGISVHYCAGFGDDGFCGYWTLEITVTNPVRLYIGMPIGQLQYNTVEGESVAGYQQSGSYNNTEAVPGVPNTWKKWHKYFPEFAKKIVTL